MPFKPEHRHHYRAEWRRLSKRLRTTRAGNHSVRRDVRPTHRHRAFESNLLLLSSPCKHLHNAKTAKQGRRPADGEFITVTGCFSGAQIGREAMGISWMTRAELTQAIPPAYTEFIGNQLINALKGTNL